MNDEIKEMLDYFQKDVDKYEESKKYLMQKYGYDEETIDNICQHERHINTKKLLDYITNLQQRFDSLMEAHKICDELNEDLQEENKRLLKQIENISLDEANIRADILLEQQDYKSRIEKAVEYIKKHHAMYFPSGCGDVIKYVPLEFQRDYYENGITFTETENLLDILNGKE